MNSHNTKIRSDDSNATTLKTADQDEVRVIKSSLVEASDLSISDELDKGSDPYNSTGQHVILKSRTEIQS